MGKLTVNQVKNAKPGRHQDGQGLQLYVKQSGARSWLLRLQVDGRRRDVGLGSGSKISLSEARERAVETRKQFRSGIDPVAAKKASRAAIAAVPTFREAALTAHGEQKAGWRNKKHSAQWLSSLESYAFPAIGDVRVDKVDGPMIRDLLLPIWLAKPETARRVKQRVGAVLDWAYVKGLRASEAPLRSIAKGLPRQPKRDGHFAALQYSDVPILMGKLAEAETVGRLALRFLILTAARSGEVRGATWEEINLDSALWTVPAERMKAGREHIVPLSPAALAVLKLAAKARTGRSGEPVFPGLRNRSLSDMTITKVLRATQSGKSTVHGFRSSFRDWAAEKRTNVPREIVETALAHTNTNKAEAAYRRTNYLEERRILMGDWGKFATGVA